MKDNIKTILFAFVLGIICASMLVATSIITEPYKKSNEKAEEIKNILSVLEVPYSPKISSQALVEIYERNIRASKLGEYFIYEYIPEAGKDPLAIAIRFSGPGLWGNIKGVISFKADLLTIKSISFYKQEETPGLGGEIGSKWFQDQFKGKKIISKSGIPGFKIIKPGTVAERDINSIDGITGATMTSDRVQIILDNLAKDIYKEQKNYGK